MTMNDENHDPQGDHDQKEQRKKQWWCNWKKHAKKGNKYLPKKKT